MQLNRAEAYQHIASFWPRSDRPKAAFLCYFLWPPKKVERQNANFATPYNNTMIQFSISPATPGQPTLHLIDSTENPDSLSLSPEEASYLREAIGREQNTVT